MDKTALSILLFTYISKSVAEGHKEENW